jgi:hypothetical protein
MTCVFAQTRCNLGKTYEVADAIYEREIALELHSTSADFDLPMKRYILAEENVGKFINDNLFTIDGISGSPTTFTFKAF